MQYITNIFKKIYNYMNNNYEYMNINEFNNDRRFLVRKNNIILDLSPLLLSKEILTHPGGIKIIINSRYKDITTHYSFHSKIAKKKIIKYKIGYII